MSYQALHFRMECWGCAPTLLMDAEALGTLLRHVVIEAGMRPIGSPVSVVVCDDSTAWGTGGSVLQLLMDSHASIHGLARHGHAYIDLFSCKPLDDPSWLACNMAGALRASGYRWHVEDRTIGHWRSGLANLLRRMWRLLINL